MFLRFSGFLAGRTKTGRERAAEIEPTCISPRRPLASFIHSTLFLFSPILEDNRSLNFSISVQDYVENLKRQRHEGKGGARD